MVFQNKNLVHHERLFSMMMRLQKVREGSMPNYFQKVQDEVTPSMRCDVAIWMYEVCEEERQPTAVFLRAIQYLNTFLSKERIAGNQLQLLGAACILISSKIADIPISARNLVDYSANSLTTELISDWEILVLSKLQWDMNEVVSSDFIQPILNLLPNEWWDTSADCGRIKTFVCYCAVDFQFGSYLPSTVASAAIVAALTPFLNEESMKQVISTVKKVAQVDLEELKKCTDQINEMVQLIVQGKYGNVVAVELLPGTDPGANGGSINEG